MGLRATSKEQSQDQKTKMLLLLLSFILRVAFRFSYTIVNQQGSILCPRFSLTITSRSLEKSITCLYWISLETEDYLPFTLPV
jgi:hypothetical protein